MPPKIKTNQLAGYENTAFNYRYLNTTLTPLDVMEQAINSTQLQNTPGLNVIRLFSQEGLKNNTSGKQHWLNYLATAGRSYDRTYRILADEYYRQVEEKVDA